jgi:hypothetical protein
MLPGHVIAAIESGLRGEPLVPAGTLATVTRSVPHGHVAAVWAQTRRLGLPALLGPTGRQRDLSMALIIARVVRPRSKLAITCWWAQTPTTTTNPVAPAVRSNQATRKASRHRDHTDQPVRSFRTLIDHLATLTRNDLQYGGPNGPIVPTLAVPTTQRRVFDLLDTTIPLNLT